MKAIYQLKKSLKKTTMVMTILLSICFSTVSLTYAYTDHSELISSYEGSKTCRTCHEEAASEVVQTLHYSYMGQLQEIYNMFTNKLEAGPQGKGNRY